jgi:hypothetical protein
MRCDRFSQTLCKNIIFVFCSSAAYRNLLGDFGGGSQFYRLSMIAQKHGRNLELVRVFQLAGLVSNHHRGRWTRGAVATKYTY